MEFFLIACLLCHQVTQIKIIIRLTKPKDIKNEYEIGKFESQVDHFDIHNTDTFSLKYFYSDKFYEYGGPVFFYMGNEDPIETFAENTGFIWENAEKLKAYIIIPVHRYYRGSIPYQNSQDYNASSMTYLTSEQAMRDYIGLVDELFSPNTKVITFGGSYGGMLAAWMRMKYPARITGALASSAPILQFNGYADCSSPYNIATESYRRANSQSVANIRLMFMYLPTYDRNMALIAKKLNLCRGSSGYMYSSDMSDKIVGLFFTVAMDNYPKLVNNLSLVPVDTIADFFAQPHMNEDQLLTALRETLNFYFTSPGNEEECFDLSNIFVPEDDKAWHYQTCTEMKLYTCSTKSEKNMFPPQEYNIDNINYFCQIYFGVTPKLDYIPKYTNINDLSSFSNIIFSNGELDPWNGGGYHDTTNKRIVVINIEGGAHQADLRASSPLDSPSLVSAREKELDVIRSWLS